MSLYDIVYNLMFAALVCSVVILTNTWATEVEENKELRKYIQELKFECIDMKRNEPKIKYRIEQYASQNTIYF